MRHRTFRLALIAMAALLPIFGCETNNYVSCDSESASGAVDMDTNNNVQAPPVAPPTMTPDAGARPVTPDAAHPAPDAAPAPDSAPMPTPDAAAPASDAPVARTVTISFPEGELNIDRQRESGVGFQVSVTTTPPADRVEFQAVHVGLTSQWAMYHEMERIYSDAPTWYVERGGWRPLMPGRYQVKAVAYWGDEAVESAEHLKEVTSAAREIMIDFINIAEGAQIQAGTNLSFHVRTAEAVEELYLLEHHVGVDEPGTRLSADIVSQSPTHRRVEWRPTYIGRNFLSVYVPYTLGNPFYGNAGITINVTE